MKSYNFCNFVLLIFKIIKNLDFKLFTK